MLLPRVGRITATRLSTAWEAFRRITPGALFALPFAPSPCRANNRHAVIRRLGGVSADNAWGVIRPTVCSLPVQGE
ncbi:hypothetical protein DN070_07565 [Pseudomonas aeruginosa]|nr:hypothetical protein DN070_07565 [Pseudomonas aeruginosa]